MDITNKSAGSIVLDLISAIQKNKDYLSEIDGKIGDGDHGVNMNKGFTLCQKKLKEEFSLSEGLYTLGSTLQDDIGGSMGPLYGIFFEEMAEGCADSDSIDKTIFAAMLKGALSGVEDIGNAKQGDKTLLDVLIPAEKAYCEAIAADKDFKEALEDMKNAARKGWLDTENMVAKIGRASRLGERSKGVLDAGATSCNIILQTIGDSLQNML